MNETKSGTSRGFFRFIWDGVNFFRRLIVNLIFILIVVLIFSYATSEDESVKIASGSALLLDPSGTIVEQLSYRDPTSEYLNQEFGNGMQDNPEVLLSDLLLVIDNATRDDRIQVMVLNLQRLAGGSLNKLRAVGTALEQFKAAGKRIVAIGDYYTQSQYYLASHADEVFLNPMGGVLIDGFGVHRMYYKDALAKLKVTRHIFKVGKFKSAVEPYTRSDMSEQAKLANKAWLDELWAEYKQDVAQRRGMELDNFDESLDDYLLKLRQSEGDMGQYAVTNQWVDALKSRKEVLDHLVNLVGSNGSNSYNKIDLDDYLTMVKPPMVIDNPLTDKIGVVIAKGTILDGHHKAGTVGGDSTAKLLRRARLDDDIKAVVLRVDSPGGSAFASEVIRKEIDSLQAVGKPVIASMGSVAASGGYWISASADQIWASPTTITGSIGIYGMFLTFENSLNALGVTSDGIATTELADVSLARPINPKFGDIIQLNLERGYERFLTLVAEHRNMTVEQVNEIAQGRVWTGVKAHELGLVDKLGTFDDAINAAADMASLSNYDVKLIEQELSTRDQFYKNLLEVTEDVAPTVSSNKASGLNQLLVNLKAQIDMLTRFNDPQNLYIHCEVCEGF